MNVKLLAFDTSSATCAVGLYYDNVISQYHQTASLQHGKLLLPAIKQILTTAGLLINEIDAIAFGAGPGSFTGIRLASSTAQALAYAKHRPILKLSSLQSLAQTAWLQKRWQSVLVLRDAKMGKIYAGKYYLDNEIMCCEEETSIMLTDAITYINHHLNLAIQPMFGLGDGYKLLQEAVIKKFAGCDPTQGITANALLSLAKQQYEQGKLLTMDDAQPIYLS